MDPRQEWNSYYAQVQQAAQQATQQQMAGIGLIGQGFTAVGGLGAWNTYGSATANSFVQVFEPPPPQIYREDRDPDLGPEIAWLKKRVREICWHP